MTGLWLILHSAEPDAFINCRQPEGSWSGMTSAKIRADFSNFQSPVQHLGVCCKLLAGSSAIGVPEQLWGSRKVELCWAVLNLFLSLPFMLALNVQNVWLWLFGCLIFMFLVLAGILLPASKCCQRCAGVWILTWRVAVGAGSSVWFRSNWCSSAYSISAL